MSVPPLSDGFVPYRVMPKRMNGFVRTVLWVAAAIFTHATAVATLPDGDDRIVAELSARCDRLVGDRRGDMIAVAVDDGREIVLAADGSQDYEVLFEVLFEAEEHVVCDCRDDYDARICYAVLCCRAYRDGRLVSHIVMPLNETDSTKGDIAYPLEPRITDALLRIIAF